MYEIDEQQLRKWWEVFNPFMGSGITFMGSGITAIVASALGSKYIGFEISQEYVDLANKRLQETKTLFD